MEPEAREQAAGLLRRDASSAALEEAARGPPGAVLRGGGFAGGGFDAAAEEQQQQQPQQLPRGQQQNFIAAGSLAEHELAEKRRKQLRVRGLDWVYLVANRVYFSKAYSVLYVVMILLNLVMLIWLSVKGTDQESAAFVLFEGLITLILGVEVVGRMLTQGRKYWKRWSNWFELIVLVLCIGTVLMAHTTNHLSTSEEMDELLSTVLLVARYVLQGLRLLALLRHRKRLEALKPSHPDLSYEAQRSSSLGIIDFDLVEEDEADPLHTHEILRETLDFDALVASADRHARSRDDVMSSSSSSSSSSLGATSLEMGVLNRS